MHVFVTGATGWVGAALIDQLLEAGHTVTGLARTPDRARLLAQKGAHIVAGSLDDLALLRACARGSDGSEAAAQALSTRSVRTATIRRAPSVHGAGEAHGFVPILIKLARDTGVSTYIGEGENRWAGVGRGLTLPAEPREPDHFGWFMRMAGADMAASSDRTRALTDWSPSNPGSLADLADPAYYAH